MPLLHADFTYSFFEGGGGGRGGADILNATAACDCIGRPGCACDKHASPPAANYYKPSLNSASVSFQKKLLDTSKSFQKSFGTVAKTFHNPAAGEVDDLFDEVKH